MKKDIGYFGKIARRVRRYRELRGMTIDELCEKAGISRPTLIKIERGGDAKVTTFDQIAQALRINVDALLNKTLARDEYGVLEKGAAFKFLSKRYNVYRFGKMENGSLNVTRLELKTKSLWREHVGEEALIPVYGDIGIKMGRKINGLIEEDFIEIIDEKKEAFFFFADVPHQYFNPYVDEKTKDRYSKGERAEKKKVIAHCIWIDPECEPADFHKYDAHSSYF